MNGAIFVRSIGEDKILYSDGYELEIHNPLIKTTAVNRKIFTDCDGQLTDITVLDSKTIAYACQNKILIKSLEIPEEFFNFNELTVPTHPITSLAAVSRRTLAAGCLDGTVRVWNLNNPFETRNAKYLDDDRTGIVLLKNYEDSLFAVTFKNEIYREDIKNSKLDLKSVARYNLGQIVKAMEVCSKFTVCMTENYKVLVLTTGLDLFCEINPFSVPKEILPMPSSISIINSGNFLVPAEYGFDHIQLTGRKPHVQRYHALENELQRTRGIAYSGNKIHIAITPSNYSFSTVLPEQRLDQNKTFVVQKGLKYQKVHETEKLEYNALREARRQHILENSNPSRLAVTV